VGTSPAVDTGASVRVVQREKDQLTLRYSSSGSSLLRIAIAAYPGWHASLDGTELQLLTVDTTFLGVLVPAGSGDIHLWYAPRYFALAAWGSVAAVAAAIAVLIASETMKRARS